MTLLKPRIQITGSCVGTTLFHCVKNKPLEACHEIFSSRSSPYFWAICRMRCARLSFMRRITRP